jgi:DNA-directed RNA polymerase subunit RPC12/RpoP
MYFKENYRMDSFTKDNDTMNTSLKECPDCKSKVKEGWKCCPYCGSDRVANIKE